jgi:hypothetical protein
MLFWAVLVNWMYVGKDGVCRHRLIAIREMTDFLLEHCNGVGYIRFVRALWEPQRLSSRMYQPSCGWF